MAEYLEVILLRVRRVLNPEAEITPTNQTRDASKNNKKTKMQPTKMYEEILKGIQQINITLAEEKRKSKNLGRENRRLQVSCVDLQANIESIHGQASHSNLNLEESCKKLSQDLQGTNLFIETLKEERNVMEETVHKCRKIKQSYVKKLQKTTSEKYALEKQVSDLTSENETLRDFHNLTRRKSQKEMDEVQEQCGLLKVELEARNVEINRLVEQLNQMRFGRNKMDQEYQQSKCEANEDKKKKDNNQNLNQVINKLREDLQRTKLQCDIQEKDLTHIHQLYSAILKTNQHRDIELIVANDTPKHTQLSVENKCSWLYEELQNLRKTRDFLLKKTEKDKKMLEGWMESYNDLEEAYNKLYDEYCVAQHKPKEIQNLIKDKEDDLKLTQVGLEERQHEVTHLGSLQNKNLQAIEKSKQAKLNMANVSDKPKQNYYIKSTVNEKIINESNTEINKQLNIMKDNLTKKCQSLEKEILILKGINARYLVEIQEIEKEKKLLQSKLVNAQQKYSTETEETKQKIKSLESELEHNEDRFRRMQFSYDQIKKSYAQLELKHEAKLGIHLREKGHPFSRSSKLELENGKRFFDQMSSIYSSLNSLGIQGKHEGSQKQIYYSKKVQDLRMAILKRVSKLNNQEISRQYANFQRAIQQKQQELRQLENDSNAPVKGDDIKTYFEEGLSKILREVQGKLAKAVVENDSDSRLRQIEAKQNEIISMFTKECDRLINFDITNIETEDPYVTESLQKIVEIYSKIEELELRAENFRGTKKDKIYLDVEHKLMDCIMKVDVIQAMDYEVIRQRKREAYDYANDCITKLDRNAADESR